MRMVLTISLLLYSLDLLGQVKFLQAYQLGDQLTITQPRMVLMDDQTFGEFFFYRTQFDSLSLQIIRFNHKYQQLDSLNQIKTATLRELIKAKDLQIATSHQAYLDMKATVEISLEETRDCVQQYNHLLTKHHRQKRRNKFWKSATLILSGVALIGIVL